MPRGIPKNPDLARQRRSETMKKKWATDSVFREGQSEAMKRKWTDPVFREKNLPLLKEAQNRPEVRAKIIATKEANGTLPGSSAVVAKIMATREANGVPNPSYKDGRTSNYPKWLYECWYNMMRRCYNLDYPNYKDYGERGIAVYDEWHDSITFMDWVLKNLGSRPDDHSVDRIDNNGNYEPGNIRWATRSEQQNNKRPRRLM